MLLLYLDSFRCSDFLVDLLYENMYKELPTNLVDYVRMYTREQIRYGFSAAVNECKLKMRKDRIKERKITDQNFILNEDLMKKIRNHIDLVPNNNYDHIDFQRRFSEEVIEWVHDHPQSAKKIDVFIVERNLVLR